MNPEYVIINKTELEAEKAELKELSNPDKQGNPDFILKCEGKIELIEKILSQSTPLIPEIEKAFDAGSDWGEDCANAVMGVGEDYINKQHYISTLKLNI